MEQRFGEISRRGFLVAMGGTVGATASGSKLTVPLEYPLIRAQGSHLELGRQHGEQAVTQIHAHLELLSRQSLRERALRFLPLFEKYSPHLIEEIRGLAQGARISFAEALAVNIRGELGSAAEGCTAYAIGRGGTSKREILAGQNSDMTTGIPQLGYILNLKPLNKPEVLMWTFGGMIGYHGMNSGGIAHFANALGGGPASRFGMPHYPLKRMMLECSHVDEVVHLFETVPLASNGNYVLCDGHGNILDIEATTAGPQILNDHWAGFLVHTNHFVSSPYARPENFAQSWKDSFPRLDRMNSLIQSRLGSLAVDDLKKFLSDHQGHPTGICRHDGDSRTVASLISEPAQRRMHVAVGNPCENKYVTYSM